MLVAFGVWALARPLEASIMDDLASPSQVTRDRAAREIRALYDKTDDRLLEIGLLRGINGLEVAPPSNFTGTWVEYFTNGVPISRTQCKRGRYFGVSAQFHANGSKAVIQHYTEKGCDGKKTRYYPSGRVSSRGRWRQDKQIGNWVYYDEDGTILSTERYGPDGFPTSQSP